MANMYSKGREGQRGRTLILLFLFAFPPIFFCLIIFCLLKRQPAQLSFHALSLVEREYLGRAIYIFPWQPWKICMHMRATGTLLQGLVAESAEAACRLHLCRLSLPPLLHHLLPQCSSLLRGLQLPLEKRGVSELQERHLGVGESFCCISLVDFGGAVEVLNLPCLIKIMDGRAITQVTRFWLATGKTVSCYFLLFLLACLLLLKDLLHQSLDCGLRAAWV